MFLILLGGTVLVGCGLLAAASYTDGALLPSRSAGQAIGWLLACATFVALHGLRSASWEKVIAAAVSFFCGAALLYLSYFEWGETRAAPIPVAAAATIPDRTAALAPPQPVVPVAKPRSPASVKPLTVQSVALAEACFALEGIEFLQCNRCADTSGLRRIACNERTRLEYCESRPDDSLTCTSAVPYSPPA